MFELYFRFGLKDIEKGRKVETRRPYTDTNIFYFTRMVGHIVRAVEGNRYTFVLVTGVRKQKLRDMSDEDAKREGFRDLKEFMNAWRRIYGGLNPDENVVVIEFVHYGCWRFKKSLRTVEVDGVKLPLCSTPLKQKAMDSNCAFCWLAPLEWCGTCSKAQFHGDTLYCKSFGVTIVDQVRLPRYEEVKRRRCDLYLRRVPQSIASAVKKLKSLGIYEVS